MRIQRHINTAVRIVCTTAFIALAANPAFAIDETNIYGTFDGCEFNKIYKLLDGRSLECRTYHYHYAYAPTVIVIDSSNVVIDGEEYAVWIH